MTARIAISTVRPLGEDRQVAARGGEEGLAVEEPRLLDAAPRRGRVHLEGDVQVIRLAGANVAQVEGEAAVLAGLPERRRLERVQRHSLEPFPGEHETRLLDLLAREDAE